MLRKIIKIDEEKCTGCGLCAHACHEGAIDIIDGKARLMREHFCDGLGDCLPACPAGAISFEEREAPEYDASAVAQSKAEMSSAATPGVFNILPDFAPENCEITPSQLNNWPVQIKLAPIQAPYFSGARLLIAADCTAYACTSFHRDYVRGRVTLIGCTKLDSVDYSIKLCEIFRNNSIRSVTVVRMDVPCCGGMESAVKKALTASGKSIPCDVITIDKKGNVL